MSQPGEADPCQPSGVLTAPMVFPWGDYKRIFPPGSRVAEKDYEDVYRLINDSALYWAAIMQDSTRCAINLKIFTGDVRAIEINSLRRAKLLISSCIKSREQSLIPVTISEHIMNLKQFDLKRSIGNLKVLKERDIEHGLLASGHSNVLIIDLEHKLIEYFDPHGSVNANRETLLRKVTMVREALGNAIPSDFAFCDPEKLCPRMGPQLISGDAKCFAWSLLYLHLRLKNPHMVGAQIIRSMLQETRTGPPLILDWLDVMRSTLRQLQSEHSSYSKEKKNNFERLLYFHKIADIPEQARILVNKEYLPSNDFEEFLVDELIAGSVLLFGEQGAYYISDQEVLNAKNIGRNMWLVPVELPRILRFVDQ